MEKKMNGCIRRRTIVGLFLLISNIAGAMAGLAEDEAELKLFQGSWVVVKLVEDGKVISSDQISEVLPSGGRVEIVDNSLLFVDVDSGRRRARTISVNATKYPSTIDITTADEPEVSRGIYQFNKGQLIVCIGDPSTQVRPTELSAPKGSDAVLMVLQRSRPSNDEQKKESTAPAARPAATAEALADAEIQKMLPGVWRMPDQRGYLHIRFRENGTFSTFRVYEELRVFRRVFVETPISSGSWEVHDGRIQANLATSPDPGRTGSSHLFTIKAMTSTEFIFVDGLGRSNKATREVPIGK